MNAIDFSRYAIVILLIGVSFLPIRYALMCLILLSLFDASGPGFASASGVGILNAFKVLGAPSILILRLKLAPLKGLLRGYGRSLIVIFTFLTTYAVVATFWSGWKISALKMIGYLVGYILWFSVFVFAWRRGYISRQILIVIIWVTLFLAVLQSYILDPVFGIYQFESQRFTAFVSPQYFSAFLVVLLALVLMGFPRMYLNIKSITMIVLVSIGVVLSGSRYGLLSLFGVIVCFAFANIRYSGSALRMMVATYVMFFLIIVIGLLHSFLGYSLNFAWLQGLRVAEIRYLFEDPDQIGTLAWRIGMYHETVNEILSSTPWYIVFGHGTSSGANVALKTFPLRYDPNTIDANRVIHNEFLRAWYEWGIFGLGLLCVFTLFLIVVAIRKAKRGDFLLLSVLPVIILSLTIENILAGSGSSWATGVLLVLSRIYEYKKRNGAYQACALGS
ncbi:O-antigen ligase family protein [Rhodothermus marinus]|uniref:O-antigen ligase family protein n=1 Tax=Rhodothermus marinus TaxID=29549 RepID=UPI001374EA6B|nr:O-antigen ligase family protein [Rhodothermus marinus]